MPKRVEIFPWNENFATGIEVIDFQHKQLIDLLNTLVGHLAFQAEAPALNQVLEDLKNYTVVHFATEEKIWHAYFANDPWAEWHKTAHSDFIAKVQELKAKETTVTMDQVIEEIVSFLTHWLALHIIESDKRMAKVVLAMPSGISLERAKEMANDEMAGATRILIDTVMSMYDKLANRTIQMAREISRRKKAEEALRAAHAELTRLRDEAVAANRAKSDFLATMSHEIRTPMNGVLGMAQVLLMPDISEAERKDYARTILNSGQTLMTVLNDILDLSKIESGHFTLETRPFDPAQLIREVQELFKELAHEKGLDIQGNWSGPKMMFESDPHRLRQMLSNYVGNAIKFTAQGSIRIDGKTVGENGDLAILEFSVTDTGIGIPENQIPALFKPFSQADVSTTRKYNGTGLGLSIVRGLALQMGGDVDVASEQGKGTRFGFRVQAKASSERTDYRRTERIAPTTSGAPPDEKLKKARVLVVEDNATNLKVISALLAKFGLEVLSAQDGRQAVNAAQLDPRPDLVFMDIQMPLMDGLEATRRIRKWEKEHERAPIAIVALTAGAFEDDKRAAAASGMNDFLPKPIEMNALEQAVRHWLQMD